MAKVRVGIIGCGNIAGLNESDPYRQKPCTHAGAYSRRQDVEIVGCCDSDAGRGRDFAQRFSIPCAVTKIGQLLDLRPDVVSICVPYRAHRRIVQQVAGHQNRPAKILLEKPIAHSGKDAQAVADICRENGVRLYVNNRRLSPFYRKLRRMVREDFHDEVIAATAWCSSGMHTIGIHMVDLLCSICGEPLWVSAQKEAAQIERLPYSHNFTPDDDRYRAVLGYARDFEAVIINTARTRFTYFEVEFLFPNGRIRAVDNGRTLIVQKMGRPGKSTLSYRLAAEKQVAVQDKPLFQLVIDEVLTGDYDTSAVRGEEALKSYRVIEAMRRA